VQKHRAAKIIMTTDLPRPPDRNARTTTGMHLIRSEVAINTIQVWLGHVSLQTTQIYAESDLKMKAKALATSLCSIIQ